jgi:hypothetical protein
LGALLLESYVWNLFCYVKTQVPSFRYLLLMFEPFLKRDFTR